MRICVADDETEVRESIIYKLKSLFPYDDIFDVQYGYSALELISAVRPELVLLDIRMPEMDGLEILRIVKDQYPRVDAVILTGYEDFEYARKALQLGAVDYLLKPADRDRMRDVVEKVRKRQEQIFLEELEYYLDRLSDQFVCLHDIRCYNIGLWHDDRKWKEIRIGGSDVRPEDAIKRSQDVLFTFRINWEYSGAVVIDSHMTGFTGKQDFIPVLLNRLEKWKSVLFFQGVQRADTQGAGFGEIARLRQKILVSAKAGQLEELRQSLHSWLNQMVFLDYSDLKKECVLLMALLDEGLTKTDVIVVEEEKIHYWSQWVNKYKTWFEFKENVERFILSSVSAWARLDQDVTDDHWFEQSLKIIHQFSNPALNLETVAAAVGVHPVTLSRMFKKQTGMNFHRYLVKYRLRHAALLLVSTDKPVNEIADAVGYVDYRYFRKLFKQEYGMTPSEYRKCRHAEGFHYHRE